MKILVLGSDGFLGGHVLAAAAELGHEVRGAEADRPARGAGASAPDLLELASGDAAHRAALLDAARSVDVVVAAEPLSRHAPPRVVPMVEASLQRARLSLEIASQARMARLVWVGSALAVGSTVIKSGRCNSAEWTLGRSDARVRAYVESEQWLARTAPERGVTLVRVLPSRLAGPGSPEPARDLKLIRAYARWRIGLFAHGGLNVIDVRDAARAVVRAAERGAGGERYLLGGHDLTYKAFYVAIARAVGARHLHAAIPRRLAMLGCGTLEALCLLVGRSAPLDRNFVDLHFGRYAFYDSGAAHQALGMHPRPIDETMAESVASLRDAHLL